MLEFTDLAKQKVIEFIKNANQGDLALRIKVNGNTPEGGLNYAFNLEDALNKKPGDIQIDGDRFKTFIDGDSAKMLTQATVDWSVKEGKQGFLIKNPNHIAPNQSSEKNNIEDRIVAALREIFDPEIPVNIYDLGLIYNISVDEAKNAYIQMTLTTPNCPAAEQLPEEVRVKAASVDGIQSAHVELTWDPPWDKEMMSEAAKLDLGF